MALPVKPGEKLPWSLGFRNNLGKYLTVEAFGSALNFNGVSMKKKQIFHLEQEGAGNAVFIRTHQGRYLSAKIDGSWTADSDSKGNDEKFEIEFMDDGRWALKSMYGHYCGGAGEKLDAFTKEMNADRLFVVQLAMHPQVCMWNMNRNVYCHLANDQIQTNEVIPWGADATITMTFIEETGKYALQTCDFRFLNMNGELIASPQPSAQYMLVFQGAMFAFIASNGMYLSAVGSDGVLRATKPASVKAGKDELFVLEDSHPQIKMTASVAGKLKKVSIKTGVELSASQVESGDTEMFQIEINDDNTWCMRCSRNTFWILGDSGAIKSDAPNKESPASKFQMEWLSEKLAIKAANGKYLEVKKNGAVTATSAEMTEDCQFVYELTNRPNLVLRGKYGFVNSTEKSGQLMATSAYAKVYAMHVTKGVCEIRDPDNGFWTVADEGKAVSVKGSSPTNFFMDFVSLSKFALYYFNGSDKYYLKSHQNGALTADGTSIDDSTLFEY
eukprot:m.351547 g.351547  ORF g.351547 m.351547 type:complete len:500 (-) comp16274_c0_seq1:226-1725(-)